jgi:hypothetical protein
MAQPFDSDKVAYAFRYYGHLMTEHERLSYRHFVGVLKASYGHTDEAAQLDSNRVASYLRALLPDDPQVLTLIRSSRKVYGISMWLKADCWDPDEAASGLVTSTRTQHFGKPTTTSVPARRVGMTADGLVQGWTGWCL